MAFQEMTTETKYYRYKDIAPGTVLCEGWFVGTSISKYKKTVYRIQDENGNSHCLNHAGHLEHCFKAVRPEDYIRVSYVGEDKLKKGDYAGSEAHRFKMEIDKSRCGKRLSHGFQEVAEEEAPQADSFKDEELPL